MRSVASVLDSDPGPKGGRIGRYLTMTTYYASFATSTIFLTAIAFLPLTVQVIAEGLGVTPLPWLLTLLGLILVVIASRYLFASGLP